LRNRKPEGDREETKQQDGSQPAEAPEVIAAEHTQLPADEALDDRDQILVELTAERDRLNDQLLRSMADLQNFRKRAQQREGEIRQYAAEGVVQDLLPVLDNFERTIKAAESGASLESLLEGVNAIARQFRSVLDAQNVSKIPTVGQQFDPELHEAVASEPSEEHEEGAITEELSAGYRMREKVIRPARVKVARNA
jgi:molecular chaperone GrpE